jgi:hypothetical protein
VKRPRLFKGFWFDTATGENIGRATQLELREACRLWWRYRAIREQSSITLESIDSGVGDDRPLEDVVADEWTQIGIDTLGEA